MRFCGFILFGLFVHSHAAFIFPASPCPRVFTYEDISAERDKWYGELTHTPTNTITGVTIRFLLDRPAHLFVSWDDPVTSNDNQLFIMNNNSVRIESGETIHYKVMVKFDQSLPVPFVQTIHFNGRRICPPDLPLTLSVGEGVTNPRPDLEFPDPFDTLPDIQVAKPTRYGTYSSTTEMDRNIGSRDPDYPCGLVNIAVPLITHGASTSKGQWPWHVALYRAEGINLNFNCGATLVSKNKVITAAHCVTTGDTIKRLINPNQIVLYLGKHKLNQFVEDGSQTRQVSKIVVHPSYSGDSHYGDVAVLTLSKNIEYSNFVRPICLWESVNGISDIIDREGSVVGWGLDENEQTADTLKVAKVPVVSMETCIRSYPQFYSQFTSNGTFCAGSRNGTSPCNGDSGGGIVFSRNNIWYLRGLVSLSVAKSNNLCDAKNYIVFTDLTKFGDFIQANLL